MIFSSTQTLKTRLCFITRSNLSDLSEADGVERDNGDCEYSQNRETDMAKPIHFLSSLLTTPTKLIIKFRG